MRAAALGLAALLLGGCAFGMSQMTPEQLAALAKDKNASVTCFSGMYAGANINMLFLNTDKGVPAGVTIENGCKTTFDSRPVKE